MNQQTAMKSPTPGHGNRKMPDPASRSHQLRAPPPFPPHADLIVDIGIAAVAEASIAVTEIMDIERVVVIIL